MPGDVVFGDREGVYFVPPHLVEQIVKSADEVHIHDEWTQMMMKTGKYKSSELYPTPKDPELKKQYEDFKRSGWSIFSSKVPCLRAGLPGVHQSRTFRRRHQAPCSPAR